jgi:hypothetical protein
MGSYSGPSGLTESWSGRLWACRLDRRASSVITAVCPGPSRRRWSTRMWSCGCGRPMRRCVRWFQYAVAIENADRAGHGAVGAAGRAGGVDRGVGAAAGHGPDNIVEAASADSPFRKPERSSSRTASGRKPGKQPGVGGPICRWSSGGVGRIVGPQREDPPGCSCPRVIVAIAPSDRLSFGCSSRPSCSASPSRSWSDGVA